MSPGCHTLPAFCRYGQDRLALRFSWDETWQWHRERGDYSRWIAAAIKDSDLAAEIKAIEDESLSHGKARRSLREAIERRYTLPA